MKIIRHSWFKQKVKQTYKDEKILGKNMREYGVEDWW